MKFKLLAFAFIATLVYSCNKPPEACIEVDKTTASIGEEITFTSCSKRAQSYIWFFEGPVGAPENNIGSSDISFKQSFSVAGTYSVKLEAYKKFSFQGEMTSTTRNIVIQ